MRHIPDTASMSAALRAVLDGELDYSARDDTAALTAELDRLAVPGPCPAGVVGWDVDDDGNTTWRPGTTDGQAQTVTPLQRVARACAGIAQRADGTWWLARQGRAWVRLDPDTGAPPPELARPASPGAAGR